MRKAEAGLDESGLFDLVEEAGIVLARLLAGLRQRFAEELAPSGIVEARLLDRRQFAAHGFAWLATYDAALAALRDWARSLRAAGRLGPAESLILRLGHGEYLAQILGGIALAQGEICRPQDLGLDEAEGAPLVRIRDRLLGEGAADLRADLAAHLAERNFGNDGLTDEALLLMRDQFRDFAENQREAAHRWHLEDRLIPDAVIADLAAMGTFGIGLPEEFGGAGLGKQAVAIATEELSRGFIGLGSLGTRAEIAGELIQLGGNLAQKRKFLPGIASGAILPTAVFTEPDTGSDLGSLKTRAQRAGDYYRVTGAKTWITHAARADLMTILVRTDSASRDYRGLSMLLAEKPRGQAGVDFPIAGLRGSEIPVLGYRGMKEFELAFDDFAVPVENLLGDREGAGFKQLMATFESARIQTAARAVGVAMAALETALDYAVTRRQFGRPIYEFPRISGKIAAMAVETMIARQLTYAAAKAKDGGQRCDIPAGMAKLLAARIAWSNADNALQIHGGNGYALEYPVSRLLCDARILNIFEGAAEIQAQIIARGLLTDRDPARSP